MKEIKNIIFGSDKENLTDKAFKQSITISVFGILFCMIALCSTTFAWFFADVSSSANNIQSAHCDVTVTVKSGETEDTNIIEKYTFEKNKDYVITIRADGSANSAYCVFVVDDISCYTEQVSTLPGKNVITFTLRFSEDKEIEIITCWGVSSKAESERTLKNDTYYLNMEESTPVTAPEESTAEETATEGITTETATEEATTEEATTEETATEETTTESDTEIETTAPEIDSSEEVSTDTEPTEVNELG